jgi:flagellar biogenesis protein FliO
LSVLGTTTIGPRQQVTLVQVGRKVILIGSAPGGLARLGEFDAETVTADQRQGGEQ